MASVAPTVAAAFGVSKSTTTKSTSSSSSANKNKSNLRLLPAPFGMYNQGVNCYMNSLLQALITLGPFQKCVATHREQLEKDPLGRRLVALIRSAHERTQAWDGSANLVQELRREGVSFGQGEESASEAFVLLLEHLDEASKKKDSFTRIFESEYWRAQKCTECGKKRERRITNCFVDLFGIPRDILDQKNARRFGSWLEQHVDVVEDYHCTSSACNRKHDTVRLDAHLELEFAPPCLLLCFGAYRAYGQETYDWWFPPQFTMVAQCTLTYRAVATVEHSGTLQGGHYWAKALRLPVVDGEASETALAYTLNDLSTLELPELSASRNTYLVFYVMV